MKKIFALVAMVCSLLMSAHAFAGVDLIGRIQLMWINGHDGKLWVSMDNPAFDTYCVRGWNGVNLYIKTDDKNFPYYYSMLATAQSKNMPLYIANISAFNGTTACDLAATQYGVVVMTP